MTEKERKNCIDFCIKNDPDFSVQPTAGKVLQEEDGYYFDGEQGVRAKLPYPVNEEEARLMKKMLRRPQYIYAASVVMRHHEQFDRCLCFRYLTNTEEEAKEILEEDVRRVYCQFKGIQTEEKILLKLVEEMLSVLHKQTGLKFITQQVLSGEAKTITWKRV